MQAGRKADTQAGRQRGGQTGRQATTSDGMEQKHRLVGGHIIGSGGWNVGGFGMVRRGRAGSRETGLGPVGYGEVRYTRRQWEEKDTEGKGRGS